MAELARITLPNGNQYDLKDAVARQMIGGGIDFRGITTTLIYDGSVETNYLIDGVTLTAKNGDMVIYNKKEFIYSASDNAWHEFGDNGSYGMLAYSDEASANYTPSGTISRPQFTGTPGSIEVEGLTAGSVNITVGEGTSNYTPEGTISKPAVNVEMNSTTGYVAETATGGGLVTPGTAASCTMPDLTFNVVGETLSINWSEGSFTANKPTAVQLPTFAQKTIATGVKSAELATTPTFTGKDVRIAGTFTGANMTAYGTYTPEGEVTAPTFTGHEAEIVVQPVS